MYFRRAIALYQGLDQPVNLNWSYLWLGYYLMWQCRFDEARQLYHHALGYYQSVNNTARQARAYGLIAKTYIMEGHYTEAIDFCLKEVAILEKDIKYHNDPVNVRNRLGELYMAAGDSGKALEYYHQIVEYWKGNGIEVRRSDG